MCRGRRKAEHESLPYGAALADEVRGDERLAVAGRKSVGRAEQHCKQNQQYEAVRSVEKVQELKVRAGGNGGTRGQRTRGSCLAVRRPVLGADGGPYGPKPLVVPGPQIRRRSCLQYRAGQRTIADCDRLVLLQAQSHPALLALVRTIVKPDLVIRPG